MMKVQAVLRQATFLAGLMALLLSSAKIGYSSGTTQLTGEDSLSGTAEALPPGESDRYKRSAVKFFTADHAVFRYDDETLQLEVYALIDRGFLKTEPCDSGIRARYRITFTFFENDSLITGDSWTRIDRSTENSQRLRGQKIPELVKYRIKPGTYRYEVEVIDLVQGVFQKEENRLDLHAFPLDAVSFSDIMIASRIERAEGNIGEFDHNGLLVLPNAERMFGQSNSQLFYYSEIYNLSGDAGSKYTVAREILDQNRKSVKPLEKHTREIQGTDCVEMDAFSIGTLKTGTYSLVLTVTDENSGQVSSSERTFWVYRPGSNLASAALGDPGFDIAAMTPEEISREIRLIRYILPTKIASQVNRMEPDAQRTFLAKFWIANDPDKSTTINEYRERYMKRVQEANARYGSFRREGWTTDRGRVYLLYGEPDNIEDHPFDPQYSKAFQIWYYDHIEGGVSFVFVDRNGYGDYVQVHSDKNGELANPNWRSLEKLGRF